MRYQRAIPDSHPLTLSNNAKKSNLKETTMCTEDGGSNSNSEIPKDGMNTGTAFEGGKGLRFRSPSRTQDQNSCSPPQAQADVSHIRSDTSSPNRGDVLLHWGQKKRARVSRCEIRPVTDDSSSSSSISIQLGRQPISNKAQRRIAHAAMPPPPPPNGRGSNLRNGFLSRKESSGFASNRSLEEHSAAPTGSPSRNSAGNSRSVPRSTAGKRSPPPETSDKKKSCSVSAKDNIQNGSSVVPDRLNRVDSALFRPDHKAGATHPAKVAAAEKVNVGLIEWPRIYIALSRKEKEDDFFAMKGTKLPQRPKKRAKTIDRTLQYCFPGMWLSDLTRSRYEVREKKSAKKQRRKGLKGMGSMESDSE